MKVIMFFIGIMILANCSQSRQNKIDNLAFSSGITENYSRDKKQIANCFIENVEYFRKYHRYDFKIYVNSSDSLKQEYEEYYQKYPGANRDPANFFEPYASRFDLKQDKYVKSPVPTEQQLTVTVDTIVYSQDSLFCVAFLVLHLHYDEIKGLEQKRDEDRGYSAKAVIGYRANADEPLNIYPLKKHSVIGFESYKAASTMIKDLYFNRLKGIGSTGSVYEGTKFKQNVGDKGFFKNSPYFQRYDDKFFNFQMYRHLGKDYPYNYQQCR